MTARDQGGLMAAGKPSGLQLAIATGRSVVVSKTACTGFRATFGARMTFQAGGTPAKKLEYARQWSSPMCAFPASGQPPTVIFCVQDTTRPGDQTPQQRLGM
jgi:hypothetical protein